MEVEEPIINSPYREPQHHWKIHEHEPAEKIAGRRMATYTYLLPGARSSQKSEMEAGFEIELLLVSLIRKRLAGWRPLALRGEGGVSRITMELLHYWRREGRKHPLFFAQLEAAESIIFLTEARADFRQGINIPEDQPGEKKQKEGFTAFHRRCCKMATGAGKTVVMGMLAAWSILNKINNKNDPRFSDAILVVCPNVTIRNRLAELNPQKGEASIYRTRDLVPEAMMPQLSQGKVHTTNWHVFEPHSTQAGSKVIKAGKRLRVTETIFIGDRKHAARGRRYMSQEDLYKKQALGLLRISARTFDKRGEALKSVEVESEKYIESDAAVVRRTIEKELGPRRNILVFNDEAHHAYRLRATDDDQDSSEGEMLGEDDMIKDYYNEATVWVDGLDKIHKQHRINFCVDFSATPYFLGRAGHNTNRIFPWTVSDFGLQDAIEAGIVKIPQLVARDSSGNSIPGYFNIWEWILQKLTSTERGGRKSDVKPEAVLKYSHTPISMIGGMWQEELQQKLKQVDDKRPPVFIIVCKTKKLAKIVYEWLANSQSPTPAIPPARLAELLNSEGQQNTICVYSDVQKEMDSGHAHSDEDRWMRHTLDTIGKTDWPRDQQRRAQYPDGFEELAQKLKRPKHPPGRDVRCIVSVGMLTEGWDCNTVTHIIGLRPFMSQLLCEQVIGRGLRRASYEVGENGLMREEIATVLGVPLSSFTVKRHKGQAAVLPERHHIHTLAGRKKYAISFPRVEGYRQSVRHRLVCDMAAVPPLDIDNEDIPQEIQLKAGLPTNGGQPSLYGPGKITEADLQHFRQQTRMQHGIYMMALALVKEYGRDDECRIPSNVLFSQLYRIVKEYITKKVSAPPPADVKDIFLSPYYGWAIERLRQGIKPDEAAGESPELPRYERLRGNGSTADVDFYTRRAIYPVEKSHINAVVADTQRLEQSTAYRLDKHPQVFSFAKNEGLGFGIPYTHNGEQHDYQPDFLVRLHSEKPCCLILETKGYDPLKEIKKSAAERWVAAVNADGKHGTWHYRMVGTVGEVNKAIDEVAAEVG